MVVNMHPTSPGFQAELVAAALRAALAVDARVPVFALSGLQGTGKSTLAAQMAALARSQGLHAVVLSLDDLYLPRWARQQLAAEVHPLLATRGPPGTHDVALGCALLDALRMGQSVLLPRFDKLADDRVPTGQLHAVDTPVDLVIVEGWCLGAPAEDDAALAAPINALECDEDAHGVWRAYCNRALARDYPALWQRFDQLWFLQPPGFEVVVDWRWQQEQALAAAQGRPASMDRAGIVRFVQHFERVSRQALRTLPAMADHVVALDAARGIR
ncbi:D-glycerate 3-kinase [Pseudoxanthomonas indica]|uniref:D-glycerate 3-kinase n=2 Tax=Pseudoxanthomonas indica TaxID=428993 RepID=A0A1T5LJQ9_9GAMM|nr:D-glycerate 3-kinase [Pseudoxanthomonas indica]